MLDILVQKLGLEPWITTYVLLSVLIFMARILDVSIGTIRVIFFVIKRDRLNKIIKAIKRFNPKAFNTIESVKGTSEFKFAEPQRTRSFFGYLSLKRK